MISNMVPCPKPNASTAVQIELLMSSECLGV